MKETLSTIASRCGVSVTTASRVLSGNSEEYRISVDTARKVIEDARRCGYSKGVLLPRRKSSTKTIGLLIPSLSNLYFATLANYIISQLGSMGYFVIIMDTREDEAIFEESLYKLIERNVEGIIATPCGHDPSLLEDIRSQGVPVVQVDRHFNTDSVPYVVTNNYKGAIDAMNVLLSYGHKNIMCIKGTEASPTNDRVHGYCDAMRQEGLEKFIQIVGNEFSIINGYVETKLMLQRPNRPTAIFCLSNNITLGALKALRESGVDVPRDVSLISFDSFVHMDYTNPSITRIAQPIEDMAMMSIKILLKEMNEGISSSVSQIMMSSTLVHGMSVKNIGPRNKIKML